MPRPAIPLLSPTKIADAALMLVEQTGDLQMVDLAKHLNVAPSSLYSHVRGRAEVIDLARLRMLERLEPLSPTLDWREAVEGLLRQLVDQYARHPKLLPLIFATTVTNARAIAVYEPVFLALQAGGFRTSQLRLIIALIEFQAMGLAQGLPEPAMSDEIRAELPGYTASIDHSRYDRATSTDFSTEVLLVGLTALLEQ